MSQVNDDAQLLCQHYGISVISANELKTSSSTRPLPPALTPVSPTSSTGSSSSPQPNHPPSSSSLSSSSSSSSAPTMPSLSQRLSDYDRAASYREEKKQTTIEDKIVHGGRAVKVLSLARNGKQESITTFDLKDRMSTFQEKEKEEDGKVEELVEKTKVESRVDPNDDDNDDDTTSSSSSSSDSGTDLERRRSSYRETANQTKVARKQYSVLEQRMAAEEERMSVLYGMTSETYPAIAVAVDNDGRGKNNDGGCGDNNTSHLPGLKWKPKSDGITLLAQASCYKAWITQSEKRYNNISIKTKLANGGDGGENSSNRRRISIDDTDVGYGRVTPSLSSTSSQDTTLLVRNSASSIPATGFEVGLPSPNFLPSQEMDARALAQNETAKAAGLQKRIANYQCNTLKSGSKDKSGGEEEGGWRRRQSIDDIDVQYRATASFASRAPPYDSDRRRVELQVIMKDKSLSKEERRVKMEEVRMLYASGYNHTAAEVSADVADSRTHDHDSSASNNDVQGEILKSKIVSLTTELETTKANLVMAKQLITDYQHIAKTNEQQVNEITAKSTKYLNDTTTMLTKLRISEESQRNAVKMITQDLVALRMERDEVIESLTTQLTASKKDASKAIGRVGILHRELKETKTALLKVNATTTRSIQSSNKKKPVEATTEHQHSNAHERDSSQEIIISDLRAKNEVQRMKIKELKKIVRRDMMNEQLFIRQHEEIERLKALLNA